MVAGSVLSDLEAWRPKTPFHRIIVPVASFVLILFVSLHYALSANAGPSLIVEEKQGDGTRARGLINAYFDAWNKHDVEGLRTLLAHDCKLTDWETQVSGRDAVVEANRKIFEKMPEVKIQVLATHLFKGEKSATCEILVKTGKEDLNVAFLAALKEKIPLILFPYCNSAVSMHGGSISIGNVDTMSITI
eukprot:jgi/Bigna1/133437/aug1.21_g8145